MAETANGAVAPPPIVQTEANNILWTQLVTELSRHYEGTLKVVFPAALDERTYAWFRVIEEYNFRSELRYTLDELKSTLSKPELLFLFVFKGDLPEIVVLGYTKPGEPEKVFRLDTFAINKRGKGIGHIVMDFLIKWARAKLYAVIELDTEETDEKGIRLQRFYEKHKFVVVSRDAKGDITMRCALVETGSGRAACTTTTTPSSVQTSPAEASPPTSSPPASPPPTDTPPTSNPLGESPAASAPSSAAPPVPAVPTLESTPPPITALVAKAGQLVTTSPSPAAPPATSTMPMTRPTESKDEPEA